MLERIRPFFTWVRETWEKATRRARLLFLLSVMLLLVLILILTLWLNRKDYVALYQNLTIPENAQVIAVLDENGIEYEVDRAGRLMVDRRDEGAARLQLAYMGFSNPGFGYDIANGGGLTATQQDKDRNYIFSVQDRLQAEIELTPEIQRAVVNIGIPQRSALALSNDNNLPTASVVLQMNPGKELTTDQVRGLVNLVKNAVVGLEAENISITDANGDLKSSLDLEEDFNNRKLSLTHEVNTSIERKILDVVERIYGAENVEVQVMTQLNTDSNVAERLTYLPLDEENPTNNPLDYSEFDRQHTGDGFPAAGGVPGANDNVETPQYEVLEAEGEAADYYAGHDIYDYLVGNLREQIVKDGFTIERASVAILINDDALPDGDINAIIALASNASGIDSAAITVQGLEFEPAFAFEDEPLVGPDYVRWFLLIGIPLLIICIILIVVLTVMARRRREREAAEAEAEALALAEGQSLAELMGQEPEFEPIALVESAEQKLKLQIKDLAESDPEIVAQLIKVWLNA